jgi:hypothetical protein
MPFALRSAGHYAVLVPGHLNVPASDEPSEQLQLLGKWWIWPFGCERWHA